MKAMRVKKIYQTQSKRAKGPKDRRCSAASAINKSPNRNVYCPLDKRCDSPDVEMARRSEPTWR
jgi:hypothetical protein